MNIFQKITDYVKRDFSTFDMSNNWIGSILDFGSLNKIYSSVVMPADQWKLGHNAIVKLPPLTAPAFTRIKGLINSFYVSYQSVWNYWNSFISNKPEDAYLTRGSLTAYNGKFVEPYVPMAVIAMICKIAKGYFSGLHVEFFSQSKDLEISFIPRSVSSAGSSFEPSSTVSWTVSRLGRFVEITENAESSLDVDSPICPYDNPSVPEGYSGKDVIVFHVPYWQSTVPTNNYSNLMPDNMANLCGFGNLISFFVWCCQSVVRNLENAGVPCDVIARSPYSLYKDDKFNVLNHMCESYIWQEFYRDAQNQASEPDYREVNGCIIDPRTLSYGGTQYASDTNPFGWYLRLNGLPPNTSMSDSDSGCYFRPYGSNKNALLGSALSILTGFLLKQVIIVNNVRINSGQSTINLVPDFYNGLLCQKYRNFEKDYFTSASIDPLMGGMQVDVPSTIDALRTASKFEEYLERWTSAKDFVSFMESSYGEKPRERYVKPVFLGSQEIKVQIGEQLQTSESTSSSPLGERAGTAEGYSSSATVYETFKEYGFLVSYLSFIIPSQYMEGMPHEFMHHLQFDYPWPDFANLGAEMIPMSEIYYGEPYDYRLDNSLTQSLEKQTSSSASVEDSRVVSSVGSSFGRDYVRHGLEINIPKDPSDNIGVGESVFHDFGESNTLTPFGYTPRYSKWKFKMDVVAGQMRDSMDFWHTFRQFMNLPHIGNSFVSYMFAGFTSDINRIFAVVNDNTDKFYVSIFNNGSCRRCLPLVPSTSLN